MEFYGLSPDEFEVLTFEEIRVWSGWMGDALTGGESD